MAISCIKKNSSFYERRNAYSCEENRLSNESQTIPFAIPVSLFPTAANTSFNEAGLLPRNIVIRRMQKWTLCIPDPLLREQRNGVIFRELRRGRDGLPGQRTEQRCWYITPGA